MTQATFIQPGDSIDYTPGSAVSAGDVVVLGSRLIGIAKLDIAASALGALALTGLFHVVKVTGAITNGAALYWDADADPVGGTAGTGAFTTNSALGPFAGFAVLAAGESAERVYMRLCSVDAGPTTLRSALGQDDNASYQIPLTSLRVWDARQTNLPGTAANDDAALITGTFLTDAPQVEGADAGGTTATNKLGFEFTVPPEYVAGQTVVCRVRSKMKVVSDGTATVDVQVVRRAAPTVDVCATAAQSINSATAADKDFTITATNIVPGDVLIGVVTLAVTDAGNAAPDITAVIEELEMLLDIKG